MSVGVGPNHREIDYGEEAEVEGKDQESEKRQKGRPGAEKEEVLGKEEQREEVGREEGGREEGEAESQEGSAAEESGAKSGAKGCAKSRAQACGSGSCTGRSGAGTVLVALRVELRWQRRRQLTSRAPSKSDSLNTPSPRHQGAARGGRRDQVGDPIGGETFPVGEAHSRQLGLLDLASRPSFSTLATRLRAASLLQIEVLYRRRPSAPAFPRPWSPGATTPIA
jgi:hypothetical protein